MISLPSYQFVPGNKIWGVIWCVANIAVYALVLVGMKQGKKIFLLPALIVSIFDVIVGLLQAIIAFFSLWIPS